jgi:hypothetical protein
MGLYEGESLLYFMIVQRDSKTVKWLLDKNARFHVSADPLTSAFFATNGFD